MRNNFFLLILIFVLVSPGKNLLTPSGHKKHLKTHLDGPKRETHPCDICGKYFFYFSGRFDFNTTENFEIFCKPFSCTSMAFNVGEVLGSKIALKYHGQAKHSDAREFSCHICGKTFKVVISILLLSKFVEKKYVSCMKISNVVVQQLF